MKLNQFLTENIYLFNNLELDKGNLESIIPKLLQLDEFKDVEKINVINLDINPTKERVLIYKYYPGFKFNKTVNLLSISLSTILLDTVDFSPRRAIMFKCTESSVIPLYDKDCYIYIDSIPILS